MNYTVYTKQKCTYCDKVKDLLKDVQPPPIWIDCTKYLNDATKPLFLQFIQDTAKLSQPYKTFPMVFCNGRFVGGFTEANVFHERNQFITNTEF